MKRIIIVALAYLAGLQVIPVHATDLFAPGAFPALASDRRAQAKGDVLTVVIYENASASNQATSGTRKSTKLGGSISAGKSLDESAQFATSGGTESVGSTGRSGQMVAQITVTVDEVMPNGDLQVSGEQTLRINGELTHIRIRGRVRSADISAQNAVISSRLADAAIDYDGSGFVSRAGKPGIIGRIFNFLGLM